MAKNAFTVKKLDLRWVDVRNLIWNHHFLKLNIITLKTELTKVIPKYISIFLAHKK